jgi:hypothetical protein
MVVLIGVVIVPLLTWWARALEIWMRVMIRIVVMLLTLFFLTA